MQSGAGPASSPVVVRTLSPSPHRGRLLVWLPVTFAALRGNDRNAILWEG
jgi:hypothetical protein